MTFEMFLKINMLARLVVARLDDNELRNITMV